MSLGFGVNNTGMNAFMKSILIIIFSGFEIKTEHRNYGFKPVSVQTLWYVRLCLQ